MALTGPTTKGTKETFFLLFKYTEKGIRDVKKQSARVKRASSLIGAAGAECRFYLTVAGPYDMISVVSGISDEGLARAVLAINSGGTVQTTVVKSLQFSSSEYTKFLGGLP